LVPDVKSHIVEEELWIIMEAKRDKYYTDAPERQRQCVEKYKIAKSIKTLSNRYSINLKTVIKWIKRTYVQDSPKGPKDPHSTVLF
jgi:hypothetical protein